MSVIPTIAPFLLPRLLERLHRITGGDLLEGVVAAGPGRRE